MELTARIKGMVCPRCLAAVKTIFMDAGFTVTAVELGAAHFRAEEAAPDLSTVHERLRQQGFELLDDKRARLVARLKELVDEWILSEQARRHTFACFASEALHQNYYSLSVLFSETQSLTLERYLIGRRVELARERLRQAGFTLTDIAEQLGYSSVHHFSNQFKKETGLSPSAYARLVHDPAALASPTPNVVS